MSLVVGTAGHIDHGKTTLLHALTGMDADRLPEERRRGMTIDLGYAHTTLDDGRVLDFVDVPGHDRLVGNMLVGAGEIDAALLVVAADDGPRPQTVEHLELLDALGVTAGIAVVTKTDLARADRVAEVADAIRSLLARTTLAGVPVLAVSAATGEGIDELRTAIARLPPSADPEPAATRHPGGPSARLAVDRVFTVRGRGVVVTGTLRGGSVAVGQTLVAFPAEREVRVREVQVHGQPVRAAGPGRVALNLTGTGVGGLHRGALVAAPGAVVTTDRLLVAIRPAAGIRADPPRLPGDRAVLRLHLGTEQLDARVGRAGREAAALDGGRATALLRLHRPVGAGVGDRFVLRRPSPGATAGGGVVLDPAPPRGAARRRASPERLAALDLAVRRSGPGQVEAARLALHGAIATGHRVALAPDVGDAIRQAMLEHVLASGGPTSLTSARSAAMHVLRRSVALAEEAQARAANAILEDLVADGSLVREADRVAPPGRARTGPAPADVAAMDRLVAMLDVPAPPPLGAAARAAGCGSDAVRALDRAGRIVPVDDDLAWAASAWERIVGTAVELARAGPLTPAALRDATGTSRKYVMALLEDLNRRGVLARTEAGHRPGPRVASVSRAERAG